MGDKSKIEWLDGGASWNPITGCTPISEGCANCYARTMAETRLRGMFGYDKEDPFKVTYHFDKLEQPLKWKKPRKIFVCSMGDLFHEDVPTGLILDIFGVITGADQHTFLILTKRPERMKSFMEYINRFRTTPLENVWIGVTAENQRTADERIPTLLDTPAAKRFVSVEPMLEQIDLNLFGNRRCGYVDKVQHTPGLVPSLVPVSFIDWVICGAETGPNARPMSLDWARDLRNQCAAGNVPFFFKKAGPIGTLIPVDLMIREYPKEEL